MLALAERLSNDLGVTVTLQAGLASNDVNSSLSQAEVVAGRQVSLSEVAVSYATHTVRHSVLRLAATDVSVFMGSHGGTAQESGIKLTAGTLGLVLYKTLDESPTAAASTAA